MSVIHLHLTGSPTITGTMWLGFGMSGRPARAQARLHRARRAPGGAARSISLAFRWRIEASAPAATAGGSEVVKMKPGAIAADEVAAARRSRRYSRPSRRRPCRACPR